MNQNLHALLALGLLAMAWGGQASPPSLIITEFMADNATSLRDEDGDASDWIEIYNASAALQNLDGWSLTDELSAAPRWHFPPGLQMPSDSYLIVFASGKDRTNATALHANFGLSARGEYLGLIDPLGKVASEFSPRYPAQHEDISYGRDAGDFSLQLFFPTATPGARNATGGPGFTPEVLFSRPTGTFPVSEGFPLALTTASSNAVIYYALGTNIPSTATLLYTNTLWISNSTIVRARALEPGLLPGPIGSRTYVALAPEVMEFSSDLPLMILHNFGQGPVLATGEEQFVAMQTFEPALSLAAQGRRASLTNAPTQAERGIFHVRGFLTAVTSTEGKASFLLELQDELGPDKDVALLGLPEESDWVLYAPNAWDRALIQNPMAHQLFREFGGYSSRTRFFEMFLKDDAGPSGAIGLADYYGLFVLEERVKRDPNRVDIEPLQPEHINVPEVTGGYMLSIDETNGAPRLSAGGTVMNWEYPTGFEMTNALRAPQLGYIRGYFNTFNAALNSPSWTNAVFGYAPYIDVDSWIDYHLHCVITFNADALRLSSYLYKPRGQPIKLGPPWDFDRSQGSADMRDFNPLVWRSLTGSDYFNETLWWSRLFRDPDFWQRWIDHYQQMRQGPLAPEHLFELIDGFAQEVREAQGREQVRWDILPRAGPTNAGSFVYNFGSTPLYDNEIRFKKFWYTQRLNFIDTQFLARPVLNCQPGLVEPGFALVAIPASKPGSAVLCMLDGSDPRLPGGGISPLAISNRGLLVLNVTTNLRVTARSYNLNHRNLTGPNNPPISSPWSGPVKAAFYTALPPLRITEIMYHPESPPPGSGFLDEDFEFIEFKNIGVVPLNVRGFKLSGGVRFDFPEAVLQPGELAVIAANLDAFAARYPWGPRVFGVYSNRLDNAGERLVLHGPLGEPILDFVYADAWYTVTDGLGFSLVHKDPMAAPASWGLKSQWRPSALPGAFPAADDPSPASFPQVVINEVWPAETVDAIELHNVSAQPAHVGGWFLTDDFRQPKRFRIPLGTMIEPGGFLVFNETSLGFGFNPFGEQVYLFAADEDTLLGYTHGFDFGPIESGGTFGRHVTSAGDEQFPAQIVPTSKAENAGPRVGPIVLTEIHYHPPDHVFGTNIFDNDEDEFIELYNASDQPVPLYAAAESPVPWTLSDAVAFTFPTDVVLPPLGFALIVGFDQRNASSIQAFRSRHDIPESVDILGPFVGKLDNSNDRVELKRPLLDIPAPAGQTHYALVERVHYTHDTPWPAAADGLGRSLQRVNLSGYGNDPAQWVAAEPTPGRLFFDTAGPDITLHPSNATVVASATATFNAAAAGPGPLGFQWRFNGRAISEATHPTLKLQNVQPAAAGVYDVVVMNPGNSATSGQAILTVLDPVQITLEPQNQIVDDGAAADFFVIASGERPLTYQWRFNGNAMPDQTSPALHLPHAAQLHQGTYDVVVSNPVGSLVSSSAMLAIKRVPSMLAPSPALQISAVPGQALTLGAQLHGTFPLWVRWRLLGPGGSQTLGEETLPSPGPLPTMVTQAFSFLTLHVQPNSGGTYVLVATNAASIVQTMFTNAVLTVLQDSDHDLMPDLWETEMGLQLGDAIDADLDADADGLINRDEYLAGTNPRDLTSILRLNAILLPLPVDASDGAGDGPRNVRLAFEAVSNRTYAVQYSDQMPVGQWKSLQDVLARTTNRLETVIDTIAGSHRYYRLLTPAR